MNPLYNQMQGRQGGNNFLQQFMNFKKNFSGNAQEQVQQLLDSGRVSQEQYNQAVKTARQLQGMLGNK